MHRNTQEYKLCGLKDLVQILTLTPTSHMTLDELVNLSWPRFSQSFFQIKPEKLQKSPGTKNMTSMWGFSASLGRQPWPLGIYNFFQMEKWEEVNIFMQSRTFQKPSFIFWAREQSEQLCAKAYRLIRDHSITALRYSLTSSGTALKTRVGWQQSWITLFPKRGWTRRKVRWRWDRDGSRPRRSPRRGEIRFLKVPHSFVQQVSER